MGAISNHINTYTLMLQGAPTMKMADTEKIAGSPADIERIFGLDAGTLANLRSDCRGPRYRRIGRKIVYLFSDVREWMDQYTVQTRDTLEMQTRKPRD